MHTRVHLPAYQENPKYRRLRKDNIGYFRRDSHGLCRIALLKDQGNVLFFVMNEIDASVTRVIPF